MGVRGYRWRTQKPRVRSGCDVPTVTILVGARFAVTERGTRPVMSQEAGATSLLAVQLTIPRFLAARHHSAGGLRGSGHQDLRELVDQHVEPAATRAR